MPLLKQLVVLHAERTAETANRAQVFLSRELRFIVALAVSLPAPACKTE